ncbi:unnamed protein product, partial [Ectocarpus fasciculatus]
MIWKRMKNGGAGARPRAPAQKKRTVKKGRTRRVLPFSAFCLFLVYYFVVCGVRDPRYTCAGYAKVPKFWLFVVVAIRRLIPQVPSTCCCGREIVKRVLSPDAASHICRPFSISLPPPPLLSVRLFYHDPNPPPPTWNSVSPDRPHSSA